MRIDLHAAQLTNRETGEVRDVVTVENLRQIIGFDVIETETGFVPGGWWEGEYLGQERAEALAHTSAHVNANGAFTIEGGAGDADKQRILAILESLPRDAVHAEFIRVAAEADRRRAYLRAVAEGKASAPFHSRYRVVDDETERAVSRTLGL